MHKLFYSTIALYLLSHLMKNIRISLLLLLTVSFSISCKDEEEAIDPINPIQEDLVNGAWDQNTSSTFDPNTAVSRFTMTERFLYITDVAENCILTEAQPAYYEFKGDSISFQYGEYQHIKIEGDELTLTPPVGVAGGTAVWTRIIFDFPNCN